MSAQDQVSSFDPDNNFGGAYAPKDGTLKIEIIESEPGAPYAAEWQTKSFGFRVTDGNGLTVCTGLGFENRRQVYDAIEDSVFGEPRASKPKTKKGKR